jgi:hypothetical protein
MYVVKSGEFEARTMHIGEARYYLALLGGRGTITYEETDSPPWWGCLIVPMMVLVTIVFFA